MFNNWTLLTTWRHKQSSNLFISYQSIDHELSIHSSVWQNRKSESFLPEKLSQKRWTPSDWIFVKLGELDQATNAFPFHLQVSKFTISKFFDPFVRSVQLNRILIRSHWSLAFNRSWIGQITANFGRLASEAKSSEFRTAEWNPAELEKLANHKFVNLAT